ncbi:MAG TPA: shikimate dehydrogenase [Allosphingosinicella sp.]|nr:shikimate dehydrogenase [Allosphingosinicella sp.]
MGVPYAEVIGDPIAHSESPTIHKFWLRKLGIDGDYSAVRVSPQEFPDYLDRRRRVDDWRGCYVTMPLKEIAFRAIDSDPVTKRIGSLNTIIHFGDGGVLGANTDWIAFNLALDTYRLRPKRPAVIGTGGTARAAMAELHGCGVRAVDIISRSKARAAKLLEEFEMSGEFFLLGSVPDADLLINASPLGMHGFPALELDIGNLPTGATVVDMVYNPLETPLLKAARERGLRTIDGLSMLMHQASMAFTYFFKDSPANLDAAELRQLLTR